MYEPLGLCSCGAAGALFSPGRDTISGPGGILIKRGEPARATCITCWNAGTHIRGQADMVERVRPREEPQSKYNGPDKAQFNDVLGEYTEIRFHIMKWTSKASKLKNYWERKGGEFEDVQHGFKMGRLTPDEQRVKITARSRVEGWLGIATVTEEDGQISFTAAFDQKPDELGAGGAPLGSRLSLARAATDGYNTGKGGGSLADCPFHAESEEAHAWAEAYGDGMQDRVERAPREKKANGEAKSATEEMAELAASMPVDSSRLKPVRKMAAANDEAEPAVEKPKKGARQKAAEGNGAVD